MRPLTSTFLIFVLVAGLGCSRDPEVLKKKYVENGNKYFNNGKYKEASILYRKALGKDARYGEAYARLAEAEMRLGRTVEAVRAYQRAVELLPNNTEVAAKLANLYLAAFLARPNRTYLRAELTSLQEILKKRDPMSYEALRLEGYVAIVDKNYRLAIEKLQAADRVKPGQPDVVVALAQSMIAISQNKEAEELIRRNIEKNKNYSPMYDLLTADLLRQGRIADAEEVLKLKIRNNPKQLSYRLQLAGLYAGTQRASEMDNVLQEALDNSSDFPDAHKRIGEFFVRIRQFDRAKKLLEQAIQTHPEDKLAYQKMIVEVLAAQGKPATAMDLVDKLLTEHKDDADLRAARASLVLQTGDRDQLQRAIDDLVTAAQKSPHNFVIRHNLGRAYMAKEELEAARIQFQEALKSRPDYLPSKILLAQVHLSKKEYAKALQFAGEALDIDERNLHARLIRSAALMGSGELSQARKELSDTLQMHPGASDAKFQLAMLNLSERKLKESETLFRSIQAANPQDPRGVLGLIETYMAQGRHDEAKQILQNELAAAPDRDDVRLALANIMFRSQDYAGAISHYRTLLAKKPEAPDMMVRLGIALARNKQYGEAEETLKKAAALSQGNPAALIELGMLYEAQGRRNDARPLYERVLQIQPDNPIVLNNLAYILADEGKDLDLALTYAQRAKQKLPNNTNVADTLGWIYVKKNLSDNAIQIFRDLTAKNPDNAEFRYHLAMALLQKGDKGQAKKELEVALRAKPNKSVEEKIRQLISRIG